MCFNEVLVWRNISSAIGGTGKKKIPWYMHLSVLSVGVDLKPGGGKEYITKCISFAKE
jgi:hypothetical protein